MKQKSTSSSPAAGQDPRRRWRRWLFVLVVAACAVGAAVWAAGQAPAPQAYGYEVVASFPHDPDSYCQGLVYDSGFLFEGTGRYGKSELKKVELESGRALNRVALDPRLFGEGITTWGDKVIQLTWKENVALVYDKDSLREVGRFHYSGEGWGLTHDGEHLIMSDGSPTLRFLDPDTFRVVKRLTVRNRRQRVRRLNELEYVNGEILANVWYQDYILRISPTTGEVTGWIDLRQLWPASQRPDRDAVLNGIAYDAENSRLLVTGKHWPKLFEIRLIEP